jgi:hypothetical protein
MEGNFSRKATPYKSGTPCGAGVLSRTILQENLRAQYVWGHEGKWRRLSSKSKKF